MLGMGWIPDLPDVRDHSVQTEGVRNLLDSFGFQPIPEAKIPSKVDLREWFPPVENQGALNTCTAHAAAAIVSYFEKRTFGDVLTPSRLFIYKATRNLMFEPADKGAFLRTTMQSLATFGAPSEQYWPYIPANVNVEPPSFLYAMGTGYRAKEYFRYDVPALDLNEVLKQLRIHLANGIPSMFGTFLFTTYLSATKNGELAFPNQTDHYVGTHAMAAVGYDDDIKITHPGDTTGTSTTTGAFLVRNSYGADWGLGGYAWLPYEYLLSGLATDWWSMLKQDWINPAAFQQESAAPAQKSRTSGHR
jgi:C1A family cysteine protease